MLGAALLAGLTVSAQISVLDKNFYPQGISNEGKTVGHYDQNDPYIIWNPDDNSETTIGGISAGNGFGGQSKFSEDGKYICGEFMVTHQYPKGWNKTRLSDLDYTFYDMINPIGSSDIMAVGKYGETTGIIAVTADGNSWTVYATDKYPFKALCSLTQRVLIAVGDNGLCAYSAHSGVNWMPLDPKPAACTDNVKSYTDVCFSTVDPYPGIICAELENGEGAVYQSPAGGDEGKWVKATGIAGIPLCAGYDGTNFFIGTADGKILKSTDSGVTWAEAFDTQNIGLSSISFNGTTGIIAAGNGTLYRTTDGGKTWNAVKVSAVETGNLRNAKWIDGKLIAVGDNGISYQSDDNGGTWAEVTISKTESDLCCIASCKSIACIAGTDIYVKTDKADEEVGVMGRYNVETGEWQSLGHFGLVGDGPDMGSAYGISADGQTVVGLGETLDIIEARDKSYKYTTRGGHATAWTETTGLIDLGSRFPGHPSRANAVSRDGRIIVGFQDNNNGQRASAVWFRNPDGTYAPSVYINVDPEADPNLYGNIALEAEAVSPDGKWVGGHGRTITSGGPLSADPTEKPATTGKVDDDAEIMNQPYLWNTETKEFRRIGMIEEYENDGTAVGYVKGIADGGKMAVGFFLKGNNMKAFIWTEEHGMMPAVDYLADILKFNIGKLDISSILDISANGNHIAAWGFKQLEGTKIQQVAFRIDLTGESGTGVDEITASNNRINVYTDADQLHIALPAPEEAAITLYDIQGHAVMTANANATIATSHLPQGIYITRITTPTIQETHKIMIRH